MPENDTRFAGGEEPLTAREAFGLMNPPETEEAPPPAAEHEEPATPPAPAEGDMGEAGAASEESADEVDAAAADDEQQPPGETDGQDDTEDDTPAIDPPRSWSDADKEAFKALPHDVQQRIAERERARDGEIRRRQDEAAKVEQAAQAREQAAEQARQHYEQQLPILLQTMQSQFNQEFQDVQSWEDVQKMSQEDPGRFLRWQAMREQGKAVQEQVQSTQARQQRDAAERLQTFMREETERFLSLAPEFADKEKAPQLQAQAFETLEAVGFQPNEIRQAWTNGGAVNVHDHRFQLLVRKALKYDNAQKAVKKKAPTPKPVPRVQRPGPAPSRPQEQRSEHIQALDRKLSQTGSLDAALALLRAQRG